MFKRWAAVLLAAALVAPSARADAIAEFYRGKQIQLLVGYGTGGAYDVHARLLARHLGRHIPGHPEVVVQNVPSAASLRAINHIYNSAPADGTTLALCARNMPLIGMVGGPKVHFDPRRLTWIGSSSSFANDALLLIVRADGPARTIEEARMVGRPALTLGATSEGAAANDVPIILRDTIGLNIKKVVGYSDTAALYQAIERGQVHGRTVDLSSVRAARPEWLKPQSGYQVLVQFARATRHPDFPDVPTAREVARSEAARRLIELTEIPYMLSRPLVAPPGVPEDRAQALRQAFLATHRDPAYLEEAARLKIDVSPVGAEAMLQALDRIEKAPPQVFDYLRKLFAESPS